MIAGIYSFGVHDIYIVGKKKKKLVLIPNLRDDKISYTMHMKVGVIMSCS